MNAETVNEIKQILKNLTVSDRPAALDGTLVELENVLRAADSEGENHVVYLISDLRQKDWLAEKPSAEAAAKSVTGDGSVTSIIRRVADQVDGFVVVDVGDEQTNNITVEGIKAIDKTIVAGIDTRFEVTLVNHGDSPVTEFPVVFTAGASRPTHADHQSGHG